MSTHHVARFSALGFDFTLDSSDPAVRDELHLMWGACRVDPSTETRPDPLHRWCVTERPTDALRWHLQLAGVDRFAAATPGAVTTALVWELNQAVVATARARGLVVVHAAGIVVDDVAVVLPGASGSGKSTLVARLVADGADYLSDEAVALDVEHRRALPYPKPITLKGASRPAIATLTPATTDSTSHDHEWNLAPSRLRPEVATPSAPVGVVVVARFRPGAACVASPVTRAEGLAALAQQAFHLRDDGVAVFRGLERVATHTIAYSLEYGDAAEASAAICALTGPDPETER